MFFVLIFGRWLLPIGKITRDQLSQLLFVYIGMASDIMELFLLFETEDVLKSETLPLVILSLYTSSLMQYTLVLTATKKRSSKKSHPRADCCMCCETEIWSLLITVILQDGPFLAIRLYVIIELNAIDYNILFFTSKNTIVVSLQLYRFVVVVIELCKKKRPSPDEEQTSVSVVDTPDRRYEQSRGLEDTRVIDLNTLVPAPQKMTRKDAVKDSLKNDEVHAATSVDKFKREDYHKQKHTSNLSHKQIFGEDQEEVLHLRKPAFRLNYTPMNTHGNRYYNPTGQGLPLHGNHVDDILENDAFEEYNMY